MILCQQVSQYTKRIYPNSMPIHWLESFLLCKYLWKIDFFFYQYRNMFPFMIPGICCCIDVDPAHLHSINKMFHHCYIPIYMCIYSIEPKHELLARYTGNCNFQLMSVYPYYISFFLILIVIFFSVATRFIIFLNK